MKNKPISIKTIFNLILDKKSALIYGQIVTLLAILVSVPIPMMLPIMVDEVLLDKPSSVVEMINATLGSGSAFYYIAIVAVSVITLRFLYYVLGVITTKIFTKIAKYVTFMIRSRAIKHLQSASMNEYETLGSGAITANLITDINTLDSFIMSGASRFVASALTLVAVGAVLIMINPILEWLFFLSSQLLCL
jgi:ATP-binding cassette subfamily C protein